MSTRDPLVEAFYRWMTSGINEHGTPYVSIPEDFTPKESDAFIDFVREPRFVSRDEQHEKLRSIISARRQA